MTTVPTFEEYLASLTPFAAAGAASEPEDFPLCLRAAGAIEQLDVIDRERIARLVADDAEIIRVLGAVAGLSQERLKTWLSGRFRTAGWMKLGRSRPDDVVAALDEDFGLIELIEAQRERTWTWADVLAREMSSRQRASGAIRQGRDLEDAVEAHVEALGARYEVRTRFVGRGGMTAPADFVVPSGQDALIAVAVKAFDSTGSKLSDATREIVQMVEAKTPRQYIFAIVDGQGWLRRQNDLRRIHRLWEQKQIDGVFARGELDRFAAALRSAARRVDLIP